MGENRYRVNDHLRLSKVFTGSFGACMWYCQGYMSSYMRSHNETLEWSDEMTVRDEDDNIILQIEEVKLPAGFACTEVDGNEWSFIPDTESMNVSVIESKSSLQYVCNLDVEQVEKLKACLDAWLLYMKG